MSPSDTPCHPWIGPTRLEYKMNETTAITTLSDVLAFLDRGGTSGTRRRDMVSAIKRLCDMAGTAPASVSAEPPRLREMLSRIRPAAHGVSAKSYSNQRSLLAAALQLAGIIDPLGRGSARCHPEWKPLLDAVADDQRMSNGIAAFANWGANHGISPGEVKDGAVQRFLNWLETKTLYPKPRDCVRRIPHIWSQRKIRFLASHEADHKLFQSASQAPQVVRSEPKLSAGSRCLSCAPR